MKGAFALNGSLLKQNNTFLLHHSWNMYIRPFLVLLKIHVKPDSLEFEKIKSILCTIDFTT